MVHLERFESLYTHTHMHLMSLRHIFLYLPFIDTHTHTHSNLAASIIVCVCQRDRADSRVSDTPPPRWLFPVASCPLAVYCSGMFYNAGPVNRHKHLTLHVCAINRHCFFATNSMDNEIWILICRVTRLEMLFIIGYGSKNPISESSGR